MNFLAIIPARYASTRFPGKPLARLGGKPVIQRVYEQVAGVLDDAVVATDDERIRDAVRAFGGRVEMTSPDHRSGTDRCWEAYCKQGREYDVVVNVQGDEPFYPSLAAGGRETLFRRSRDRHRHARETLYGGRRTGGPSKIPTRPRWSSTRSRGPSIFPAR
jgi:kdsB: 3-deoxy-D-manno-octulosonate cytidylyltransferase